MGTGRRILFAPKSPLTASAASFLGRESIHVEIASDIATVSADAPPDLVIVDTRHTSIDALAASALRLDTKILGIGTARPPEKVLDLVEAFLVEPFSQGELVGAIGDMLDMKLRRALRIGVEIPAQILRESTTALGGTLLQLSETGCLLECDSPIRVGQTVGINFVLPSNREQIQIDATIVSTNELQLLYGLKWSGGFEPERLAILVFVELGLASGASPEPRGSGKVAVASPPSGSQT